MADISTPIRKMDDREKAAGEARYTADLTFEGMLHAKTVRSTRARACIKSIIVPPLPPGYATVDHSDIPAKNAVKMIFDDQPFLAGDTVNYIGEPILLVVGPDKAEILRIIANIQIEYEDIPAILSMEDADRKEIPHICPDNSFAKYHYARGKVETAFKQADKVIEHTYRTGYQEQAYMEPQGMTATYENGKVTIYGSMQCPYYIKNALIQALGWEGNRIRVVQAATGGAFGGKEEYPSIIAGHAAFAAIKTGKPVQLIFDRTEDMTVTTKRHPAVITLKTALDKDNNITAMQADIQTNAGAYAGLSNVVLQRTMFNIAGVYNIPALDVSGRATATNTVPTGAFRGFGAPQAIFAIETHMDAIAKEVGEDPLDFKMRHMVKKGDLTATGGIQKEDIILPELIAEVCRMSGYKEKSRVYTKDHSHRGMGISLFLHGCGFTGSGERDHIKAVVKLVRHADGMVEILVANVDMGQGAATTLKKIVATAMDIPFDTVIFPNPDTDRVPDSGPTVASRTAMIVGRLLQEAALELKNIPGSEEVEVTKQYVHPDDMEWDDPTFKGDAYPAYSWGVIAAEVKVNPVTLETDVKGVWSAFDVGKALDDRIMKGQIDGGIMQGLGFAYLEVMQGKDGWLLQKNLTDYMIPTTLDIPAIQSVLLDNPCIRGPYGVRGAGELPLLGAAPALAAAISNALNIEVNTLPLTPEELMEGIKP